MIDFIIVDDNKEFTILLKNMVLKFMRKYPEIEKTFHLFASYGKAFEQIVMSPNTFKVYLLDIETKNGSGLDASRLIREKYDDWDSIIIIVTSHEEFKYVALGNRLFLFDFINKLDNLEQNMTDDLKKIMKKYNKSSKGITFEYDYEVSKVELRDIVYIEKEIDSKKCIIKTLYGEKYINSSLSDIYKKLDDDFMKVSRSLIINLKKIKSYNTKENTVYFIDNSTNNLISREYKKELKEYVRRSS